MTKMSGTNGPFGRPLDNIAKTYQEIHSKTIEDTKKVEAVKAETDKPVKEETVNEISGFTLHNYQKKAKTQRKELNVQLAQTDKRTKEGRTLKRKFANRGEGLNRSQKTHTIADETVVEAAQNRFFTQLAAKIALGKQGVENLNAGKCPRCGSSEKNFRDALSAKEHGISGLCQKCQDHIFTEPKEETQLDEISGNKLAKYVDNASDALGKYRVVISQKNGELDVRDDPRDTFDIQKRRKGIDLARAKVAGGVVPDTEKEDKAQWKKGNTWTLASGKNPQKNFGRWAYDKNENGVAKVLASGVKKRVKEETVNEAGSIRSMWTDKKRMTPGEMASYAEQDRRAFERNNPDISSPRIPDSDREAPARRRRRKGDPNYDTTKERDMDRFQDNEDRGRQWYGDPSEENINEVSFDLLDRYMDKARKDYNATPEHPRKAQRKQGLMLAYNKQKVRARVPASYGEEHPKSDYYGGGYEGPGKGRWPRNVAREEIVNEASAIWPKYDVKKFGGGELRSTTIPKEKIPEYTKDVVAKGLAARKALADNFKKHKADYMAQWKKQHQYEETTNEARWHSYDDFDDDRSEFADPGGHSALRAATKDNPRIYPCPSCHAPNRLTRKDKQLGYQCDTCADKAERGLGPED